MSIANFSHMLVSETEGWSDIAHQHLSARQLLFSLVAPLSLLPPLMYAYSERMNPGAVFPLSMPAIGDGQLLVTGIVLFVVQLVMVSFMATIIQRMSMAHDHDPGYEQSYALAAIAPVPLWLSALALFVPSVAFNVITVVAAWVATVALIRHGVRPLLQVDDVKKAHYIANMVTMAGVCAWVALMVMSAAILSMLLVWWEV